MKLRTKITVIAIIVMSLGVKAQQTYNENVNINGSLFVGNNPGSNGEIIHVRNPQATGTNQSFGGIKFSSAPGFNWVLGKFSDGNTGKFQIRDQANTERFTILPSGYVGIGTSTPSSILHIVDNDAGSNANTNTVTHGLTIGAKQTGGVLNMGINANGAFYSWIQSRQFNSSHFYDLALNPAGGNVGIGTTSPNAHLEINKANSKFRITNGSMAMTFGHWDGVTNRIESVSKKLFITSYDGGIAMGNDGSEQFILAPNGNIGIGTMGPASRLHIKGKGITSSTEAFRVDNSANGFALVVRDDYQIYSRLQTIGTGYAGKSAPTNGLLVEGNVGIGTENTMGFKLAVKGKIGAGEIEVKSPEYWPDYVFSSNYNLKPLTEVETFIEENNHLPDIPSEKEVKEKGINLGDMDAKLLQKIEELTLYMIEQNKKTEALLKRTESLEKENQLLKEEVKSLKEK